MFLKMFWDTAAISHTANLMERKLCYNPTALCKRERELKSNKSWVEIAQLEQHLLQSQETWNSGAKLTLVFWLWLVFATDDGLTHKRWTGIQSSCCPLFCEFEACD